MKKPSILRTIFTGESKSQLVIFVESVILLMFGNKTYQELQGAITNVKAKLEIFKEALIAAEEALPKNLKRRDEAYAALIFELHILSSGIEFFSRGDVEYMEGTGMTVRKVEKQKKSAKPTSMVAPQFTKVEASKTPGHIDLFYTEIPGTKLYGFEYSEDQITWKNGQYSQKTSASVLIPTRKDVWVRVRALGVNQSQSEFSAATQVFIA
jgi:hypothetical protein